MGGVEFRGDTLVVDRAPNELDTLAIEFTAVLEQLDIEHVYVAGYVAILTGRSRVTEDVDVLIEGLDGSQTSEFVDRLQAAGMWGPAMPLDEAYAMLSNGDPIWVAPRDQVIPHIECKFVRDDIDQASLANPIPARIGGTTIPIGPLEIAIAYKLYLGSEKDFEDALHLFTVFTERLRRPELERWVEELGVERQYDELRAS